MNNKNKKYIVFMMIYSTILTTIGAMYISKDIYDVTLNSTGIKNILSEILQILFVGLSSSCIVIDMIIIKHLYDRYFGK